MTTLIIAVTVLIPGILLIFWINKRKFNRRNAAGLEGFSNYETSRYPFFRKDWKIDSLCTHPIFSFSFFNVFIGTKTKGKKFKD